jgi:hypothetical protein
MRVKMILASATATVLTVVGCVSVGGGSFHKPSEGFQPKRTYNVSIDTAWKVVRRVLENERIAIASSEKAEGRITTDYVEGATQVGIIGSSLTTRYRYNLSLEKVADTSTKLTIICTLESSSEGMAWHDISKDNEGKVTDLENWLYELIEKSI